MADGVSRRTFLSASTITALLAATGAAGGAHGFAAEANKLLQREYHQGYESPVVLR